jgi:hypothetical protein
MANPAARKGTRGETDRVNYFKSRGWKYATRIPKAGAKDKGDMVLDQAVPVMIESKEVKAFTPSTFIAEMEAQIIHAQAEFGFVIVKKKGTTDVGKYYCLLTVDLMMDLLEKVYPPPCPPQTKE